MRVSLLVLVPSGAVEWLDFWVVLGCGCCGGGGVEMRVRRRKERREVEMVRSGHVLLHILLLSITLLK
jgi:hypothetical protein